MNVLVAIIYAILTWTFVAMVCIAVHEGGHLLACRLVGVPWTSLAIGAIRVTRDGKKWRLSTSDHWQGGYVLPEWDNQRVTRLQCCIILLGGPVASLMFGAALFTWIALHPTGQQNSPADGYIATIAGVSIFGGFFNLVPFQTRRLSSDGLKLWRVLRSGKQFQNLYAQWDRRDAAMALHTMSEQGIRPRKWGKTQVLQSTALQDGSEAEAWATHTAFYWAADTGDWEAGGRYINKAVSLRQTLAESQRVLILLDAAYYAGVHLRDSEAARHWISEASDIPPQTPEIEAMRRSMRLRAEAAVLLAEGKPVEAERMAQEALSSLKAVSTNSVADQCLIEHLVSCCSAQSKE